MLISELIKKFAGEKDCIHFEMDLCGDAYAKSKKNPARVSIALPDLICKDNLHDLDKWRIMLIAIPVKKLGDFIKKKEEKNIS